MEPAGTSADRGVSDAAVRPPLWPLIAVVLLLWASIASLLVLALQKTDGQLVYALDDPYIHMAMAKNLALHGVWGVSSDGFTSSSSSLAWTLVLALFFKIFGIREVIPFVLNVVLATLTVAVAWRVFVQRFPQIRAAVVFLTLAVFALATPLPALVFVGQEHILHVLLTLLFVFSAADLVAGPSVSVWSRRIAAVAALAMLLVLVRYEGLYPLAVAGGLLMLRRRIQEALVIGIAAAAPIALYALISTANGWLWAPNSVLLKGNLPDWRTLDGIVNLLGYSAYSSMLSLPAVAFLVYAGVALLAWHAARGFWRPAPVMLTVFVAMALMHLQYSQPRAFWMFRYEAHLVAIGLLVVVGTLFQRRGDAESPAAGFGTTMSAVALVVLLLISPLTERAARSAARVPRATANIYEQQYQMGRFLREYYPRAPVALNDIGAPAFLSDVKVLDLVGLASIDIARLRRAGVYSPGTIDDLARDHGVRMAIVYDRWFPGALPSGWLRAGSWTIRHPVVVGSDTVTFYATSRREYPVLLDHLREFGATLPPTVKALISQ